MAGAVGDSTINIVVVIIIIYYYIQSGPKRNLLAELSLNVIETVNGATFFHTI